MSTAAKDFRFSATSTGRRRPISGAWANAARVAFGGFFLAMAAYNAIIVLPRAGEVYEDISELSWPGVDWVVVHLVVPAATPLAALLIAFEVALAVLVVSRGRWVRVGLWLAVAFMVGLAPLVSWYVLANLPLIAGGAGAAHPGLRAQPAGPRPWRSDRRSDRLGLTLVSAPAGFGKTTLLAEWLVAPSARRAGGGFRPGPGLPSSGRRSRAG